MSKNHVKEKGEPNIWTCGNLQWSKVGGRKGNDSAGLGNGRQRHLPVVVGIVRDGADVADDEAADLIGRQDEPRQDVDHLFGHDVDDALADATRFDLHADAQLRGRVDDVIRRLATVHVVLQKTHSCFAGRAGHGRHDGRLDLFDDLFQIEELHGVAQESRQTSSASVPALPVVDLRQLVVNLPHEGCEVELGEILPLALDALGHRSDQLHLLAESLVRIRVPVLQPLQHDLPRFRVFRRLLVRSVGMMVRVVERFLGPEILGKSRRNRYNISCRSN